MRIIDQHKMIQDLKDCLGKMSPADRYDFEMFQKRDKDDEELDALSSSKLEVMHTRYIIKKTKKEVEELFKKLSGGTNDKKE
jgi:hypothetical protein